MVRERILANWRSDPRPVRRLGNDLSGGASAWPTFPRHRAGWRISRDRQSAFARGERGLDGRSWQTNSGIGGTNPGDLEVFATIQKQVGDCPRKPKRKGVVTIAFLWSAAETLLFSGWPLLAHSTPSIRHMIWAWPYATNDLRRSVTMGHIGFAESSRFSRILERAY